MTARGFWALAPLFAETQGLEETGIALFMSATVLGGALGQWPLGHLSDRMDRRKVILIAAALGVVMGLAMVLLPIGTDTALMIVALVWGAAAFPLYSLSVAHANDYAQPQDFVEVSGGLLLLYAAGAVAGPILASGVTGIFGVGNLYLFPSIVHLGLVAFVAHRMFARAAAPVVEHVDFIDALGAVQTVSPCFDEETHPVRRK